MLMNCCFKMSQNNFSQNDEAYLVLWVSGQIYRLCKLFVPAIGLKLKFFRTQFGIRQFPSQGTFLLLPPCGCLDQSGPLQLFRRGLYHHRDDVDEDHKYCFQLCRILRASAWEWGVGGNGCCREKPGLKKLAEEGK